MVRCWNGSISIVGIGVQRPNERIIDLMNEVSRLQASCNPVLRMPTHLGHGIADANTQHNGEDDHHNPQNANVEPELIRGVLPQIILF